VRPGLWAVPRRFRFGFCHETARQAVAANLPDQGELTRGLVDALHAFGGRRWRKRLWDVAIDLHYCPFYGGRSAAGGVGGQKKLGSKYHYAYATAGGGDPPPPHAPGPPAPGPEAQPPQDGPRPPAPVC